ncbi:MAG: hypothetical protein Q8O40_06460 [Chloroflexota bacterium]|nr:hypothetical protein [Chloroflexota bacterium]
MPPFFRGIGKIKYEGLESDNPLPLGRLVRNPLRPFPCTHASPSPLSNVK